MEVINCNRLNFKNVCSLLESNRSNKLSLSVDTLSKINYQILFQLIGNMVELQQLTLVLKSNGHLSQEGSFGFVQSLKSAIQIKILSIQFEERCFLRDSGLSLIEQSIRSFSNLQDLTIIINKSNFITIDCVKSLIDSFPSFFNLTSLNLSIEDKLIDTSQNGIRLFEKIGGLLHLEKLYLSFDMHFIHELDAQQLFKIIGKIQNLTELGLKLTLHSKQRQLNLLADSIGHLSSLTKLTIDTDQNQNAYWLECLTNAVQNLINLEEMQIELSIGQISKQFGSCRYLDWIQNCVNLKSLEWKFSQDEIGVKTKEQQIQIFSCLKNFKLLHHLKLHLLGYSRLYDEAWEEISSGFYNMKHLKILDFENFSMMNGFGQQQLIKIFQYSSQLTDLTITLSKVRFTSFENFKEVLSSLSCLKSLITLNLKLKSLSRADREVRLDFLTQLNLNSFTVNMDYASDQTLESLGQGLFHQKELYSLILNLGQLTNPDVQSIESFTDGFVNLKNLAIFSFIIRIYSIGQQQNNYFSGFQYLVNLRELEVVYSVNQNDKCMSCLGEQLEKINKLEKIKVIQKNQTASTEQIILLKGLKNQKQLEDVSFNFIFNEANKVEDDLFSDIFSSIPQIKQLRIANLQISNNPDFFKQFAKSFKYLENLMSIHLFIKSVISDEDANFVGEGINSLHTLEKLWLGISFESVQSSKRFSFIEGISNLTNLKTIEGIIFYHNLNQMIAFQQYLNLPSLQEVKIDFRNKVQQTPSETNQIYDEPIDNLIENSEIKSQSQKIDNCLMALEQRYHSWSLKEGQKKLQTLFDLNQTFESLNKQNFTLKGKEVVVDLSSINEQFISALRSQHNLEQLLIFFSSANITFSDCSLGFSSLVNLKQLSITFSHTIFQNDFLFFCAFKFLVSLQDLSISFSNQSISKKGFRSLGESLVFMKNLQKLSLNFVDLSDIDEESATLFGQGLASINKLQCLDLKFSDGLQVHEQGALAIANGIKNQTYLEELKLEFNSQNNLTRRSCFEIMKSFQSCEYLATIKIKIGEKNNVGEDSVQQIYCSLAALKNLKSSMFNLTLSENVNSSSSSSCQRFSGIIVTDPEIDSVIIHLKMGEQNDIKTRLTFQRKQKIFFEMYLTFESTVDYNGELFDIQSLTKINQNSKVTIFFIHHNPNRCYFRVKNLLENMNIKDLSIYFGFGYLQSDMIQEYMEPILKINSLVSLKFQVELKMIPMENPNYLLMANYLSKLDQIQILKLQISTNELLLKTILKEIQKLTNLRIIINQNYAYQQQRKTYLVQHFIKMLRLVDYKF